MAWAWRNWHQRWVEVHTNSKVVCRRWDHSRLDEGRWDSSRLDGGRWVHSRLDGVRRDHSRLDEGR